MAIRRLRTNREVDLDLTDAELTTRASDGDATAFEELYKRHSDAAWRMAYSVLGNRDDAADAVAEAFTKVFQALPAGRIGAGGAPFRPYLLVATRNAAIDHLRRTGRLQATADLEVAAGASAAAGPPERMIEGLDAAFVATAFRGLPERWRSVLWLTEVEGMPARDVAPMLGVSPNGVAQLAVRARAGLRERYLQAHLAGPVAEACRPTIGLLGAYAGAALSARDSARVDQHLAGCDDCRTRVAELEDVGSALRRVIIPVPLAVAGLSLAKWKSAMAMSRIVARSTPRAATLERLQRPLMAVSAVTASLGIIGLGIVDPGSGSDDVATDPGPGSRTLTAPPQAIVGGFDLPLRPVDGGTGSTTPTDEQAAFGRLRGPGAGGTSDPSNGPGGGGGGGGPTPAPAPTPDPTPPPPRAVPLLQLDAALNPAGMSVAAGYGPGSCTGVDINVLTLGACPPPAGGGAVVLETEGTLPGDRRIGLG